jgi:hypothetical protein
MDETAMKLRCLELAIGLAVQHHIQNYEIDSYADKFYAWINKAPPREANRQATAKSDDDMPF